MTLQLLFDLATTLTKLSMLALIYRLVSVSESRYRYLVISVIGLVSFDGIIFFILVIFQCRSVYKSSCSESHQVNTRSDRVYSPIDAYWTLSAVPQKCLNEPRHLLAAGCINTTTDFFVMVLPIPYIRRLKLPRKQQIIVISLFAGGIFVTAAGAVRTAITYIFFSDPNKDLTWNAIPIIIVTSLELFLGIVSLPQPLQTLKPGCPSVWFAHHHLSLLRSAHPSHPSSHSSPFISLASLATPPIGLQVIRSIVSQGLIPYRTEVPIRTSGSLPTRSPSTEMRNRRPWSCR